MNQLSYQISELCRSAGQVFAEANHTCTNVPMLYRSYLIDCAKLDRDTRNRDADITKHKDFVELFSELNTLTDRPAVYVFRIVHPPKDLTIGKTIELITKHEHTPATNPLSKRADQPVEEGQVLYVGKVVDTFWGRLIQHLGVHKNEHSHGLQIAKWAVAEQNGLCDFVLSVEVQFFAPSMRDYVAVVENGLAKLLSPIIGKHQ